jgi:hypothetical protein
MKTAVSGSDSTFSILYGIESNPVLKRKWKKIMKRHVGEVNLDNITFAGII